MTNDKLKKALQLNLKLTALKGELLQQKEINKKSRISIMKCMRDIEATTNALQQSLNDLK